MKKILLLSLVLPLTAFAEEGSHSAAAGSNFFSQEGAGGQKLEFKLSQETTEVELASTAEASKTRLSAEYEKGLNEMLAVGAALAYSTGTEDDGTNEIDASGMEDLEIFIRGTSAAGGGLLRFGASLGYALGDAEVDANGDENYYSGGADLTPYIGFEKSWDKCTFGGKLSQGIEVKAKTIDNNGTESEKEGGEETEIALFYEHKLSETTILGVSLHHISVADTTTTTSGTETEAEALSPFIGLGVYVPVQLGHGILKPELRYLTSSDDETSGQAVDSAKFTSFTIGYLMPL